MDGQLSDSVAVITGASRGIGAAMAKAFAQEGASLCLMARHQPGLDDLAAQLPLHGSAQVMTLALDVTDRDACFQAVTKALQHFGHIDTLVNNAGIYKSQPFLNYTASDLQSMLDVNFFGVLHFMQACLPHMQARNKGSIINPALLTQEVAAEVRTVVEDAWQSGKRTVKDVYQWFRDKLGAAWIKLRSMVDAAIAEVTVYSDRARVAKN